MSMFRKAGGRSETVTAIPPVPQAQGSLTHEQLGALYYSRGEKEKALESYREAAREAPSDPAVHKALADFCYVGLGRAEDSLDAYNRVLELRPDDTEVLQITGNIHVSLKRYTEARARYERLLALQPWNSVVRKALDALPKNGTHEEATTELRSILEEAQRSFDTGGDDGMDRAIDQLVQFKHRAAMSGAQPVKQMSFEEIQRLIAAGSRDKAIQELEQMLIREPAHAEAHNTLGVLLYEAGAPERSYDHYRRAVELEPSNAVFRKNYADYLFVIRRDAEEALRQYVALLSAQPRDAETLCALGIVCFDLGKTEDARFFIDKVLESEPWNQEARKLRGLLNDATASPPAALDAETLYGQAHTLAAEGKAAEAVRLLEQVIGVNPHHAAARNDLGVLYYGLGRKAEAGQQYEEAARLEPENAVYQKNLADYMSVEQGRTEDALRIYVQILSRSPRDPETLIGIGRLCETVGRTDAAKDFYSKALTAEPWNVEAREHLRRLGAL